MSTATVTAPQDLLAELSAKGIEITISPERPDRLRYFPKSLMTQKLIARVRSQKADLLTLLQESKKSACDSVTGDKTLYDKPETQVLSSDTTLQDNFRQTDDTTETHAELVTPYSQTTCLDCGGSDMQLQSVCAVGTGWRFVLCWKCFSRRYGTNPHRTQQGN